MKEIFKNILSILDRGEKQRLVILSVLDVLISVLDILFLIALLFVIHFYTTPEHTLDIGGLNFSLFNDYPLLLITIFFILFGIKNSFGFFVFKMQYNFVYKVASRISKDNLSHYLHGTYQNYVNIDSSIINRKISQQPIEFSHYVLNGMQQVFSQAVLILISVIAILLFDPILFILLVLILAIPVLFIAYFMKRKMHEARIYGKKTSEKAIQHLQEALAGFVESNVYLKNDFFTSRYHTFQSQLNRYLSERLIIQSLPPRMIEVFAVFGLFLLILINHFTSGNDSIQLVTIGAFMAAAYKIIPGTVKIINTMGQVMTYAYSAKGLLNPVPKPVRKNNNKNHIESITLNNVCFSYPEKTVLNSFSLRIAKGDLLGISGNSGKGKTTVANLLLGFLDPDAGNIHFNDMITDTAGRQNYWDKIAYIKQQPFFIHASIIQNITLQEGDYDKEKIESVISISGLDKIASTLPDGLETVVTENGKNFSGGQRQRIILARALYKDFDMIILDEPFNELDEASEIQMMTHLQQIAKEGKIVLLITHNKTALSFCNKTISLDE